MKKMKKEIGKKFNWKLLVLILIGVIIIFGVIYFAFFNDAQGNFGEKIIKGIEAGSNNNIGVGDADSEVAGTGGSSGGGSGSGAGGGGSSGGSAGAGSSGGGSSGIGTGSTGGSSSGNSSSSDLLCLLARPGNLPGIECSVNYIVEGSVSIRIENNIGDDISVNTILSGCSNQANGFIANGNVADFTFSCTTEDYFEEDLIVSYTVNENMVQINGIVSGPVS